MFLHHFINYIYLSLNPKKLTYIVFVFGVPINVIIIIIIIPLQYSNVKKKKKKDLSKQCTDPCLHSVIFLGLAWFPTLKW